jgi:hypothetical protein
MKALTATPEEKKKSNSKASVQQSQRNHHKKSQIQNTKKYILNRWEIYSKRLNERRQALSILPHFQENFDINLSRNDNFDKILDYFDNIPNEQANFAS